MGKTIKSQSAMDRIANEIMGIKPIPPQKKKKRAASNPVFKGKKPVPKPIPTFKAKR
jgi:hypothetical protein